MEGCDVNIIAFCLGSAYVVLFLVFSLKILRHFLRPAVQRKSNKQLSFFFICVLLCGCRIAYNFAFPFSSPDCVRPSLDDGDLTAVDVLGTLPSALFFSAFAVNIHALAVVYHSVAKAAGGLWVLTIGLCLMNILVYTTLIIFYSRPDKVLFLDIQVYTTSATEFIIACLLIVYARLIYIRFLPPNPMEKLWRGSFLCFLCFLVKAVLIIVVDILWHHDYTPVAYFTYSFFSEIVPMATMLLIFEGPRGLTSNTSPLISVSQAKERNVDSEVSTGYFAPIPPPPEPEVLLPRSATMSETVRLSETQSFSPREPLKKTESFRGASESFRGASDSFRGAERK